MEKMEEIVDAPLVGDWRRVDKRGRRGISGGWAARGESAREASRRWMGSQPAKSPPAGSPTSSGDAEAGEMADKRRPWMATRSPCLQAWCRGPKFRFRSWIIVEDEGVGLVEAEVT